MKERRSIDIIGVSTPGIIRSIDGTCAVSWIGSNNRMSFAFPDKFIFGSITKNNLTFKEVVDIMEVKKLELQNLLRLSIVAARNSDCTCNCFQAATEIGGFKV